MSANRHLGRIIALQTLYEQEFRLECNDKSVKLSEVLKRNISRYKAMVDDREFIERLVKGVDAHREALDETIQPIAPEWPLDQIARMDRLVLRIGTYELLHEDDVPHISSWPVHDEKYLVTDMIKIVVQVNGKVRSTIHVASDASEEQIIQAAKQDEKVVGYIADHQIKKSIYVPGRLVSLVV